MTDTTRKQKQQDLPDRDQKQEQDQGQEPTVVPDGAAQQGERREAADRPNEETPPGDYDTVMAERDGYLDQLLRERADFANFRRRVDQERILARQLASRDILVQLLPVMDDFNRAMAAVPEDQAESGWVSGTTMVGKKLASVLERAGVTPLDAVGQRFDPAVHEAVASEPGTSGEYVAEVYQDGYVQGQSLLRPAMVKTGDAPDRETETKNGEA